MAIVAAIAFWHPVPLMLAAFLAIVGFSEQQAGPNMVKALHAYDFGTPARADVAIAITCRDTDNHYRATVREHGHSDWEYEFIPQGWQPGARNYPANLWRNAAAGVPLLAVVDDGILIPRREPVKVDTQSPAAHVDKGAARS